MLCAHGDQRVHAGAAVLATLTPLHHCPHELAACIQDETFKTKDRRMCSLCGSMF